jgi:hypothetical protein
MISITLQMAIYSVLGTLTLAGGLVAVYVRLTNQLTRDKVRIDELDKKVMRLENLVDTHYEKFTQVFAEIKDDIHALRLLMEQQKP